MPAPEDPHENAWLRELLEAVARDLESLGAARGDDSLRRRAMRIRKRLHEGPPNAMRRPGMGVGQGPRR